jgi:type IV pilus assembly protein PilW
LPIADGIVNLQAEYAFDNGSNNGTISATTYVANDGIVDQYSSITPTTAAQWLQLLGVRFALLVRIGNEEKPNAANQCTTPTTALNYFTNRAFTLPTQPPCYRYRVFETIVPLRNALWRPA